MFPHWDQSQSGSKHLSASPPQCQTSFTAPAEAETEWGARHPLGLRPPPPPPQSSAQQIIIDKILLSVFFTNWCSTRFPSLGLPGPLSMWRSHWRKYQLHEWRGGEAGGCTLLFVFCLQRTDFVRVRQRALRPRWWCRSVSRTLGSRIRLQASETRRSSARAGSGHARRHGKCAREPTSRFSSRQETQICRCETAGRHQKLPGKYALVKYGIHFTPQSFAWERGLLCEWTVCERACARVCVHDLDTKNYSSLKLFLNTVYWQNFWKTTTSQLPGKLGNDIAWTSAVKYAWESHSMWEINICKYLRITKQHNKSNRTPGQSRGSSKPSWNRWSSCFRL